MNIKGMEPVIPGKKVGILGGGQLARMLLDPALKLGLKPLAYCHSSLDPAAQVSSSTIYAQGWDPVVLSRFFSQVDLVTFENEFVPVDLLRDQSSPFKIRFLPSLDVIASLQDKVGQKNWLKKLSIPTSDYRVYESGDLAQWCSEVWKTHQGNVVFKWARLGYDGKGTWIGQDQSLKSLESAIEFCKNAVRQKVGVFAEKKVNFKRELALVASYSVKGEFFSYPLVISKQKNGVCHWVLGPATEWGVSRKLEDRAKERAEKLARAVSLHGTFAIEFFETFEGEILVNEIAPRVHNSGHYTQDAGGTSQFENHWRAILGLPLGGGPTALSFAMVNLLGQGKMPELDLVSHLHWYGKHEARVGRKMGHINLASWDPTLAKNLERKVVEMAQIWESLG